MKQLFISILVGLIIAIGVLIVGEVWGEMWREKLTYDYLTPNPTRLDGQKVVIKNLCNPPETKYKYGMWAWESGLSVNYEFKVFSTVSELNAYLQTYEAERMPLIYRMEKIEAKPLCETPTGWKVKE